MTGWQLLTANVAATSLSIAVGIGVDRTGDAVPALAMAALAVVGLPLLLTSVRVHAAT